MGRVWERELGLWAGLEEERGEVGNGQEVSMGSKEAWERALAARRGERGGQRKMPVPQNLASYSSAELSRFMGVSQPAAQTSNMNQAGAGTGMGASTVFGYF